MYSEEICYMFCFIYKNILKLLQQQYRGAEKTAINISVLVLFSLVWVMKLKMSPQHNTLKHSITES